MIFWLTNRVMDWCRSTGRVFEITGTGGPDDVYLIRYYVLRSRFCNIFIHQFLRSDRDDLHDHPWDFATYLVRGAYLETKWDEKIKKEVETFRFNMAPWQHANRLVFRRATDQHKVSVVRDLKREQRADAALTICVTGPTKREWGFVREVPREGFDLCAAKIEQALYAPGAKILPKRVWVQWKEYLGLPPDTPGRG